MFDGKASARWLTLTLLSASVLAGCALASRGALAGQLYALITLCLVQFALAAWLACDPRFDAITLRQVFVFIAIVGLVGLLSQPLLEDDHFRYLWDGYITATTGQPYAHAPAHYFDDNTVPPAMRDVLNGINNPEIPTVYGPALQILFAVGYWIAPAALWPLKVFLLLATLLMAALLHAAGVKPRWLMLLALHPLVIKESVITAHPDLLIGVTLLAAVLIWRRGHFACGAVLACVAAAMKLSALAVLPLFFVAHHGRLSPRAMMAAALTLTALYVPFLVGLGSAESRGLAAFGGQWTFNPLLFKAAAAVLDDKAARVLCLTLFAVSWFALFGLWVQHLRQLHSPVFTTRPDTLPLPPVVALSTALLLLSPVVNPWYWLWLLPLALLDVSMVTWVAASVSLLAYAHVATQVMAQSAITTYAVPLWATAVQGLVITAALLYQYRRNATV